MLFDAVLVKAGVNNWPNMVDGSAGAGIEIVLCVNDSASKRKDIVAMGVACSELAPTPWGTTEFIFKLKEDYLFRIKQRLE